MIIDTHCHIDLFQNPEKVLQECIMADMTVISMTNLPSHFEMGYPHFRNLKRIRLALGMHPLFAESHEKEFNLFLKNLSKTSYIGEIGLDFSREGYSTKSLQIETFTKILENVTGKKKLLSIHSRRAEKEVLELLKKFKINSAIFHWYSGPLGLIDEIVNAGYYFSINSAMTESENGKKIILRIPRERILVETDSPFVEYQGRQIRPTDSKLIYNNISKLWGKNIEETQYIINSNFNVLINAIKL